MPRERILITVKTYPTLSEKHGELVCTAGLRENGEWIRLYPVPFRRLDFDDRYRKYQWIETRLARSTSDGRPESFRLIDPEDISLLDHVGVDDDWRERRSLLLGNGQVFTRMDELIVDAHENRRSLATFKPASIDQLVVEIGEREWPADKLAAFRAQANQGDLLSDEGWRDTFRLVKPLPWKFSYRFRDATGKQRELQILDWEIGALFWNCMKAADGNEQQALAQVRQKYLDAFRATDIHFFLGTTLQFHHRKAPNPWVIIGVLPIPHERQPALF